ncbi:MAG TPA: CBS domain-containing protein, partial [bacterium]|nr:CBS domain-containing protein [bacterium]
MKGFSVNMVRPTPADHPPIESERWAAWKPIASIMRLNAPVVGVDTPRETLAALFRGRDVAEVIVIDPNARPVGIVTRGSMCCEGATAGALMEACAFTLNEAIPIS